MQADTIINPNPGDETPTDPAAIVRLGRVVSVDLASATVEVDTGDVRTAAIPFSTGRAGATRIWSPPSEGEQIVLLCPGGDIESAVAIGAINQDAFPQAGNSLRELIEFADGAILSYDPQAHHFDIQLPGGATLGITSTGGVAIDGDVAVAGDLSITGTATADVDVIGSGISLKDHIHTEVQSGTGISGKPQ